MISRSFVDLLFIVLCSTIVLLADSVPLGALEIAPARVGADGVSSILADDVQPVAVHRDHLVMDGRRHRDAADLAELLSPGRCVLLISGAADVTHHRVMEVWSALRERGALVKLGVDPAPPDERS